MNLDNLAVSISGIVTDPDEARDVFSLFLVELFDSIIGTYRPRNIEALTEDELAIVKRWVKINASQYNSITAFGRDGHEIFGLNESFFRVAWLLDWM